MGGKHEVFEQFFGFSASWKAWFQWNSNEIESYMDVSWCFQKIGKHPKMDGLEFIMEGF